MVEMEHDVRHMAIKQLLITALLLTSIVMLLPTLASAVPPFQAVCEDVHIKAFRTGIYTPDGLQLSPEEGWSEGEKFGGEPWVFQYFLVDSTHVMLIDNNPAIVMDANDDMLMVVKPNRGLTGEEGMLSFVIHTGMRMIAATEVAGRSGSSHSIKARVITFKCVFDAQR